MLTLSVRGDCPSSPRGFSEKTFYTPLSVKKNLLVHFQSNGYLYFILSTVL